MSSVPIMNDPKETRRVVMKSSDLDVETLGAVAGIYETEVGKLPYGRNPGIKQLITQESVDYVHQEVKHPHGAAEFRFGGLTPNSKLWVRAAGELSDSSPLIQFEFDPGTDKHATNYDKVIVEQVETAIGNFLIEAGLGLVLTD